MLRHFIAIGETTFVGLMTICKDLPVPSNGDITG